MLQQGLVGAIGAAGAVIVVVAWLLIALAMTASAIFSTSTWFLAPAVAAWALSLAWYGREVERVLG